jgi:hypothetical protein
MEKAVLRALPNIGTHKNESYLFCKSRQWNENETRRNALKGIDATKSMFFVWNRVTAMPTTEFTPQFPPPPKKSGNHSYITAKMSLSLFCVLYVHTT